MGGDSGAASAQTLDETMVFSRFTKHIKGSPCSHGAKAEFPKYKRGKSISEKRQDMFRVFTDEIEIPVADKEKSANKVQAILQRYIGLEHSLSSQNK